MEIVYNMISYKLKVRQIEHDSLNVYPTRQNGNAYPDEYNKCGYDSSTIIIDDGHLGDTLIPENTDIVRNNIPEDRYLVLYYFHIYGAK